MVSNVIVVGAGIGGLVAALSLRQRGFDVSVLEQAPALREVGAGVQISPNGCRILDAIGVLDEAVSVGIEPDGKAIRLWNTGQKWPLFDLGPSARRDYGYPYLMLHRADLQAILAREFDRIAPGSLSFGRKIVAVLQNDSDVSAELADGASASAGLLIGADGVHSAVRSSVAPPSPASFTGCMAWRGVVRADRLPPRLRIREGVNWVGPGRHVVTYPLRRGELINFVGVVERDDWIQESWTERGSKDECLRDFDGWHQDVRCLIGGIDEHFRWALLGRPTLGSWSRGRVVLLGDACHPMLPFMAQGAVMAMEDGVVLARAIAAHPDAPSDAFAAYEAARITRANRCVAAADRNRQVFHADQLSGAADAERYVATQWSEDRVRERYDWLFRYDALGCPLGHAEGPTGASAPMNRA